MALLGTAANYLAMLKQAKTFGWASSGMKKGQDVIMELLMDTLTLYRTLIMTLLGQIVPSFGLGK